MRTNWHQVEVAARPLVRKLQVTVAPPDYTGRPARTLDPNVGDVSALPGATITVNADLGGPSAETARLRFDNGDTQPLTIAEGTATGSFALRREGTYQLHLESTDGIPNRNPIRYQLALQTDAAPSVSFLQPTGPTDLSDDLTQPLRIQLSDDHGFTRAALFYRLDGPTAGTDDSDFSSLRLPSPAPGQTDQELVHEWLLAQESGLEPEPGDVISYYVQAWDNDTVNGPKSGRTATQRLRMPSLSEQYEDLDETQTETGRQLDQLRQRSDSVQQEFQQLRRELRRTREADWQDRRQLDRIQNKQKSLDQGAEELSKKARQMNQQMQKNGLSSPEMTKKFQELQRVMEEIESSELQDALKELRKGMKNNNLRQMQEAMDEAKKKQDDYQDQLERTLSLFEQLKAQQKLEEMSRRAGELSERQKQLREKTKERMENAGDDTGEEEGETDNESSAPSDEAQNERSSSDPSASDSTTAAADSTKSGPKSSSQNEPDSASDRNASSSNTSPSDSTGRSSQSQSPDKNEDLASEQERASEQMKKLEEALKKAQEDMKDVQSAPKKKLQKLNQQLQQENLPEQMQKNSKKLRQNQMQDAQQGQQQMQQTLEQMQQKLSQMKSGMQSKQRQINLTGLRAALENTLRLSNQQEDLRAKVDALSGEGPTIRSYAREQKALSDGFETVADSLHSIAKRVPELTKKVKETSGNALRAMDTAISALDEREADKAAGHQKTSMMHLNELALLLSNLLEQMQNQKGGGGGASMQQMLQQLQKASGQQQKLNKQIQQQLNNTQGERLSSEQAKRRKELAKKQRQIKKQLEEMDVGSEAKQKILGDLEKIAEQMEENAQELEQNRRPSRELIKRQEQILTRLLNAQNSLRTQGKEDQRKGQSANDADRSPPGKIPSSDNPDQLRRDLIRALDMGYSSDYESLIKQYFELLRDRKSETP